MVPSDDAAARTVFAFVDRHASGSPIATSVLSARGGAYSSTPSNPSPPPQAFKIPETRSSASQPWWNKKREAVVIPIKNKVQDATTALRSNSRAGQKAEAKKIARGASSATSQRHGNCRKRSLGKAFQIGSETGN